jgi:hypothetical protein
VKGKSESHQLWRILAIVRLTAKAMLHFPEI